MNVNRQIHRQSETADSPVRVGTDAIPRRIAGKLVEDEHRTAFFCREFCEPADIQLQISAVDELHFVDRICRFDEITQ